MSKKISKQYRKKILTRLLPVFGALAVGVAALYAVNAGQYKEKYLPGTIIDGIDAGDMTPEELGQLLKEDVDKYSLTFKFLNDETETIKGSDISLSYDVLPELASILESQNPYTWIAGILGRKDIRYLSTELTYDESAMKTLIGSFDELLPDNIREPENARLKMNPDGVLTVVPEVNGNEMDEEKLIQAAGDSVRSREELLDVVIADGIYKKPEVLSDDKELLEKKDSLNAILSTTVTYHLSDGTEKVLDRAETSNWLDIDEDGGYVLSDEQLAQKAAGYISEIAQTDDNYGHYRTFQSTNFGTVKMGTEEVHGHRIDQAAMTDELLTDLKNHTDAEHEMTYSDVADNKDPRFGGTYVEVDILNQHVYFYIDYELYYDCDCVSGLEGSHSTPSGIFSIIDKENGRTLEGYNSDGTVSYTAWVDYWMSFYPHYGLHDAGWRDSFGGETYLWDGSHGCVNLSKYSARQIYEAIDYDTPVIVFRGQDDYVVPEDEINPNTEDNIVGQEE